MTHFLGMMCTVVFTTVEVKRKNWKVKGENDHWNSIGASITTQKYSKTLIKWLKVLTKPSKSMQRGPLIKVLNS